MKDRIGPLVRVVAELEGMAREHGAEDVARDLAGLRERAQAHRFHLLVVGQFKRGKSSVINALLGAPVLPTGVLPLTSVPTRIAFGPEPRCRIVLRDGRRVEVGPDGLEDWVTEAGNPGNRRGVAVVEVRYPAGLLRGGLVLVDTPGIGSTVEENTQAAYASLPEADAALAVLGSDPPLTRPELEYLLQATEHAARVWFLQNKVDALSEAEWRQALAFNRQSLERALGGRGVEILPVSARLALEGRRRGDPTLWKASGFSALEDALVRFLENERAEVFAASVGRAARRLGARLRLALDVRRSALLLPAQTLAERKERLERRLGEVARRRDVAVALFHRDVQRLAGAMEERLRAFCSELEGPLAEEVSAWLQAQPRLPRPEELDREVTRRVAAQVLPWRDGERSRLEEAFRALATRFAAEVNDLAQEVRQAFGELAGVAAERLPGEEGFAVDPHFYLPEAGRETFFPELSAATLSPLLPRAVALRILQRRAREQVALAVDQASGRVRYDLAYRLQETARRFASDLGQRLAAAEAELRRLLEASEEHRSRAASEVEQAVRALDRARTRLDELLAATGPSDPPPLPAAPRPAARDAAPADAPGPRPDVR